MSTAGAPPSPQFETLLKVAEIQGRGRALIASRAIKAGEVLLSDSPLFLYPTAASTSSFCSHCFRTLRSEPLPCPTCSHGALFCNPRCLSHALSSSHSPWACQTLTRLRSISLPDPDLITQAHFLIAAYSLSTSAPSDFCRLLSLHGTDAPEAPALHALLSSLSPAPTQIGFSPDLTAALLTKDKRNAFGLMEPFREDDDGRRRVRAYGIYPDASFFNHDCLPNACRFDYIDSDGERNTEIVVRAIHDIPEGREVCLSYFPVNWSYKERQRRLIEDYGFQCVCDRCEVEKNWKDEEEMENMEEEDGGDEGMEGSEEDTGGVGGDGGDGDFPHAYFFMRYLCDRDNCGGTLAPLPPTPQGAVSNVMECNVCGLLRKEEDVNGGGDDADGDGFMLDG